MAHQHLKIWSHKFDADIAFHPLGTCLSCGTFTRACVRWYTWSDLNWSTSSRTLFNFSQKRKNSTSSFPRLLIWRKSWRTSTNMFCHYWLTALCLKFIWRAKRLLVFSPIASFASFPTQSATMILILYSSTSLGKCRWSIYCLSHLCDLIAGCIHLSPKTTP